ncbi:hypothetical protein LK533_07735 [Sphingomonas sp. PL-96]|uniref:hypothetical protein n=1 Tax=Sphingomonas sp. PL-96 TaxID=2887201 RepID=UPI001E5864D7|nr:hypothetical protein [Sphingomonas sp. PL-96]MCC2976564.1 hypothetical protein [Sphingomonas sp. PL-96]
MRSGAAIPRAGTAGVAPQVPPVPVAAILAGAEQAWGSPAGRLTIERRDGTPWSVEAEIQRNSLMPRPGGGPGRTLRFDTRTGRLLDRIGTRATNPVEATDRTLSALHRARFAVWDLRWLFIAGGVLDTAMNSTAWCCGR